MRLQWEFQIMHVSLKSNDFLKYPSLFCHFPPPPGKICVFTNENHFVSVLEKRSSWILKHINKAEKSFFPPFRVSVLWMKHVKHFKHFLVWKHLFFQDPDVSPEEMDMIVFKLWQIFVHEKKKDILKNSILFWSKN